MNSVDVMQEIDDLRAMQEQLSELNMLCEELIERLAAKQYQLEIDWDET